MLALLATLAFTALTQAQTPLPANCDRNITVQAGNTCNGICAQYNVSTFQLALVNTGIINPQCSNLYVGEVVCLGITGQDCNTTYVVQSGDNCTGIANSFHIPLSTLEANNGNPCSDLKYDEVLCVANTTYPYPNNTAST